MAAIIEACSLTRSVFTPFTKKCKGLLFSGSMQMRRNNYSDTSSNDVYDIVIVGGGIVGTTLACALAQNKYLENQKILLLEGGSEHKYEAKKEYSNRVYALNKQTRVLLSSIGAWKHIKSERFTSVRKMQIWDAYSDAILTFNENRLTEELAYIVENDLIFHAVNTVLSEKKSVKTIYNAKVEDIILSDVLGMNSAVSLESGEKFQSKLVIGADGYKSRVRKAMGARYVDWDYDQMGIVATLNLSEPMENIVAWQRFLPTGPVALLPLSDTQSSLVWSITTEEAKYLLQVSEEEFVDRLNDALWKIYPKDNVVQSGMKILQGILENFQLQTGVSRQLQPSISSIVEGSRAAFPLGFGHSVQYVKSGVALVGDSAHRVHPLAGQGVNLGFGDITVLVQILAEAVNNGAIIGDPTYLNKYERTRQWHNIPTMLAIDGLHRLYKGTAAPIVLARSLGLQLTNAIQPLKKLLMQHAADQRSV